MFIVGKINRVLLVLENARLSKSSSTFSSILYVCAFLSLLSLKQTSLSLISLRLPRECSVNESSREIRSSANELQLFCSNQDFDFIASLALIYACE